MAYYHRIRDLREDSDKTQSTIAEYLGTTTQYYGLYEKGANEISFERAIMLAKYYDVSLDYIAGLTNSKKGFSQGDLTPEQQNLIELLSELSGEQSRALAELLKSILSIISQKK